MSKQRPSRSRLEPNINYSHLTKVMDEHSVAVKGVDEVRIVKAKLPLRLPPKET